MMVTTRRQDYEDNQDDDNPQRSDHPTDTTPARRETLAEKRQRWSALLHARQYHTVITEVLAEELLKYTNSTVITPTPISPILRECLLILASAPLIFTAAVDGELTRRFLVDTTLQAEYAAIQARAHIQPSIYIHLLADEHGIPPSANQYMTIRATTLSYLSDLDTDLAWQIDNTSAPPTAKSRTAQGHRKHLWTHHRSAHRAQTLLHFCNGIRARWLETPVSQRHVPFAHPPGECGYALDSHARLSQHRRRLSSNYIMNLTEDICAVLYARHVLPTLFVMQQFIIYLIFRPEQVRVAEMFCSGLLQVWVANGGGFNSYPAGLNTGRAGRVSGREWVEHEGYVRERSGLVENVRRQREMLGEVVGGLDGGLGEVWRWAVEGGGEDERDFEIGDEMGHLE